MRQHGRLPVSRVGALAGALAGAALLFAAGSGVVAAGGFAEVGIETGSDAPPVAGQEREIRISLLQHGVTPVNDGRVELTATHPESGEAINVEAISRGSGEWVASVTFPVGGEWRVRVLHQDFETSAPIPLSVDAADQLAWLPVGLAIAGFVAAAAVVAAGMLLMPRRHAGSATAPVQGRSTAT